VATPGSLFDDLRARLAQHGYHLFLTPDRPSGWWVTVRNGDGTAVAPTRAHAATRDEALLLAERLFTSHRLSELDGLIRQAGLTPPFWGDGGQAAHLESLERFARTSGLSVAAR
jgi:hypothetical protein